MGCLTNPRDLTLPADPTAHDVMDLSLPSEGWVTVLSASSEGRAFDVLADWRVGAKELSARWTSGRGSQVSLLAGGLKLRVVNRAPASHRVSVTVAAGQVAQGQPPVLIQELEENGEIGGVSIPLPAWARRVRLEPHLAANWASDLLNGIGLDGVTVVVQVQPDQIPEGGLALEGLTGLRWLTGPSDRARVIFTLGL